MPATPQAEKLIYRKMAAVLASISAVGKDRQNTQQGFKYRGIDDIYNELNHRLGEQGIFIVPQIIHHEFRKIEQGNGKPFNHHLVKMKYGFYAEDGSHIDVETMGEATDYGDKGLGKAQQYCIKIALIQTFVIPTEDDDPDASAVHYQKPPADTPWNAPPVNTGQVLPSNSLHERDIFDIRKPDHKKYFLMVCSELKIPPSARDVHNEIYKKITERWPEIPLEFLGAKIQEILIAP